MRVTQVSEQRFRPAAMVQNSRSRDLPADEGDARGRPGKFPAIIQLAATSPASPVADSEVNPEDRSEGRGEGRVGKRDFCPSDCAGRPRGAFAQMK